MIGIQCPVCANLTEGSGAPTCKAFPGGIPFPILSGQFDHRKEYPGDKGIRFTPKED